MKRVVVVGTSGAGKTHLARRIAHRIGVPHIELDALHWEPNWTEAAKDVRRARAIAVAAEDEWVLCGNYSPLRDIVWPRADTLVWLDYPMSLVMWRVLRRSTQRCITREPLWAGNVETWGKTFCSSDSIIVWSWNSWRKSRRGYLKVFATTDYPHLHKLRFTSPKQTEVWLEQLPYRGQPCPR